MVVIVREKYAVIQLTATWKMLIPERTLEEMTSTIAPTTRINVSEVDLF